MCFKELHEFLSTVLAGARAAVTKYADDCDDLRGLFRLAFLDLGRREHSASMASLTASLASM